MSALRRTYPDYGYKEATLNPTNPRNRATDWEPDIVTGFRNRRHRVHGDAFLRGLTLKQTSNSGISKLPVLTSSAALLDFGAARRVVNDASQALTVILKPGYAPLEQYGESPHLKQGAWTDLYALASIMYFAITGRPPEPAIARVVVDPVRPLLDIAAGVYPEPLLAAIDAAMAINPEDRPQSIAEFRDALGCGPLRSDPALRTQQPQVTTGAPMRTAPPTQTPLATKTAGTAPTTTTGATGVGDTAELERLLARYIGPMAKIIAGRARREVPDREGLLQRVAKAIDDPADRAEFVAAARKLRPG